jgi:hypothetical protein
MSSSRRLGQPAISFRPDTVFLDFPRTDGDDSRWPTNTTRIVDADGQVNFMEPLDVDESGQARKWRSAIGKAIATKLEMQGDCKCVPCSVSSYTSHRSQQTNMFCAIGLLAIDCSTTTKDRRTIHGMISTFLVSNIRCLFCVRFFFKLLLQDAYGPENIALSTNSYLTPFGFSPIRR